jgi:hypothetical protein
MWLLSVLGSLLLAVVLLLPLGGCSEGTKVLLRALLSLTSQSLTAVDGGADGWTDTTSDGTAFTTNPMLNGFAIGLKSAKLIGASNTYTIFDQGADPPLFIRLHDGGVTTDIFINGDDLDSDTYDTLALEVVYYEAAIQVYDGATPRIRRLRIYLTDFTETLPNPDVTVTAQDLLISEGNFTVPLPADSDQVGNSGQNLQWIKPTDGSLCPARNNCFDAPDTAPYQTSASQFPSYTGSVVNIAIPAGQEIEVDSNTDGQFVVTFTAGVNKLFFYDETDPLAPETTRFNFLSLFGTGANESRDGKIRKPCDPTDCVTTPTVKGKADFWFGAPKLDVAVEEQ